MGWIRECSERANNGLFMDAIASVFGLALHKRKRQSQWQKQCEQKMYLPSHYSAHLFWNNRAREYCSLVTYTLSHCYGFFFLSLCINLCASSQLINFGSEQRAFVRSSLQVTDVRDFPISTNTRQARSPEKMQINPLEQKTWLQSAEETAQKIHCFYPIKRNLFDSNLALAKKSCDIDM